MTDFHPIVGTLRKERGLRAANLPKAAVPDAAWHMLLNLADAKSRGEVVKTTALGLNAGVPTTTMLRHLRNLVASGLCERIVDQEDDRIMWCTLSPYGAQAIERHFEHLGGVAGHA